MDKMPLITVIIPVYNVEKYFPKCISSVLNQSYTNLEILLIDDGSTDNSGKICDQISLRDNRVSVIHKENAGISHTRNTGIKNAKAELITFIDSDDYVSKDYIQYLYDLLKDSGSDISIGAHTIEYSSGKKVYKGIGVNKQTIYNSKQALKEILLDNIIDISVWGKLYNKSLFNGIEFPNGKKFEEPATMYKVIDNAHNIICGGNANYYYQIRLQSITTTGTFLGKMDLIFHTEKMCNDILSKYPDLSEATERRLIWAYFSTLNQLLKCPDRKSYKKEEKEIVSFLKDNQKIIKKGSSYSKRDKFASFALSFGLPFYSFIWQVYSKLAKS